MLRSARKLTAAASELWSRVDAVDNDAARERVAAMRRRAPKASLDEIHRRLVYAKCAQAGTLGALGGLASSLPLVGAVAGPVVGTLTDTAVVTTLQAELVVETFILYRVELPEKAERMTVAAIAATNLGAHQISTGVARTIAGQAGRWLGGPLGRVAVPLARVGASAATNVAMTYAIGMRARALSKLRHAKIEDWPDLLREVTAIDERKLADWAMKSARGAFDGASTAVRSMMAKLSGLVPLGTSRSQRVHAKPAGALPRPVAKRAAAKKRGPAKRAPRKHTKPA